MYLGKFYKLMALLQRSKTNDKAKKKKVKMKMSTQIISQYIDIRHKLERQTQPLICCPTYIATTGCTHLP